MKLNFFCKRRSNEEPLLLYYLKTSIEKSIYSRWCNGCDPNYLIVMNGTHTLNIIHAQDMLIIKGQIIKIIN